jgi:hypothetical protein
MTFPCPSCRRQLSTHERFAGQRLRCPLCRGIFIAPEPPAAAKKNRRKTSATPAPQPPAAH